MERRSTCINIGTGWWGSNWRVQLQRDAEWGSQREGDDDRQDEEGPHPVDVPAEETNGTLGIGDITTAPAITSIKTKGASEPHSSRRPAISIGSVQSCKSLFQASMPITPIRMTKRISLIHWNLRALPPSSRKRNTFQEVLNLINFLKGAKHWTYTKHTRNLTNSIRLAWKIESFQKKLLQSMGMGKWCS